VDIIEGTNDWESHSRSATVRGPTAPRPRRGRFSLERLTGLKTVVTLG
jgi:hypothetical protein